MEDRFPPIFDKRFSIERLKALGATTFARTTNPTDEGNVDNYKQFEEGLQTEIKAPVTASMDWSNFSRLVKATMR
ncbi:hypothetical protein E5676_scaffold284G00440 [Cucumis melo var. makuwa]|uniref:Uncharacterized protein n=1 Tax=Cucumis melo var. makuwa TaxID=1194695 RepID=A0A5D3DBH2_CUCMM|nr:hypothetical protein E6C27_scaffold43053G00430 [Cucumis melo var. makuwa]TYK20906.1 hypothetical protein E5676_scaffold284G00440 [Cucumis melo var. makuwa]